MTSERKMSIHVCNDLTGSEIATEKNVLEIMDYIIEQPYDAVHTVTVKQEDDQTWQCFTLEYDVITPQLQAFMDKVGSRLSCTIRYDEYSFMVNVDNQTQQPFIQPDESAEMHVFHYD